MSANGAEYGMPTFHYFWIGAVPAMIFLGLVMMPFYYGSKVRSVPEFMLKRYGTAAHLVNALSFALAQLPIAAPTLTPRAVHERGFVLPTQRRGIVTVGPVLAVQRDPVGLLQRERSLSTPQHIHIHPRTVRLGTVLHGVLRDIEGAVTQDLSSSDVAFHALVTRGGPLEALNLDGTLTAVVAALAFFPPASCSTAGQEE